MKTFTLLCLASLASSSVLTRQQEEIDKAMKMYGDEARKLMNDSQDALREGLSEVEGSFNNPGDIKKPQESFFRFGQKGVPEPARNSAASCQSCQTQSIEALKKASSWKGIKASEAISPLKPSASSVEVIVFVSLGMPDQTLKQLAMEAEKTKARLVIRGLLDNSFKTTLSRLQELKIPVEIDPTLFELFEVERVPTFVRCKITPEGALKKGHDRLAGNIFIRDALEKFKQFGDLT